MWVAENFGLVREDFVGEGRVFALDLPECRGFKEMEEGQQRVLARVRRFEENGEAG